MMQVPPATKGDEHMVVQSVTTGSMMREEARVQTH